MALQS
ncbi:unnamed protein product [Acanthoscelides obtectus]